MAALLAPVPQGFLVIDMETLVNFLVTLAGEIQSSIGDEGLVDTRGEGLDFEIEVKPNRSGPCGFILYLQGADEITVQLGVLTTVDVFSRNLEHVMAGCRDLVHKLVSGAVSETVWTRDGTPCRAVAHLGVGRDAVTWTTSRGRCRHAVKQSERRYEPYVLGAAQAEAQP
jgi:hypothetical protein